MAGITLQGVVVISTIKSRERVNVLNDTGTIEAGLSVSGLTRGVSLAVAREYDRMLGELVWYSRHAGGVYVNSDDHDIDDGLYELSDVRSRATPETSKTALFEVSMTLQRIGGSPLGGNIVQRLRAQSTLQTNNYSITSTPRVVGPVGSTLLNPVQAYSRVTADGTIPVTTSAGTYAFTGADHLKGECKVWDRAGDTNLDSSAWKRVYSPDHTFTIPSDLVIENGLLRIVGMAGGDDGSHRYFVWTGAAWTEISASAQGDGVYVNAANVTADYASIVIDDLNPWRVKVTFTGVHTQSPYAFRKVITLERGKPLALVQLVADSATTFRLGLPGACRWVATKGVPLSGGDMVNAAFDDTEESGNRDFTTAVEDNWMVGFTTKSATVGTLALVAWRTSDMEYFARDGSGMFVQDTSVTSLSVYIGGIDYDTSSAQLEAEAGTLTGAAATSSTVAGASGSGNDQVTIPDGTSQVEMATNLTSIGGSTVLALFRIASSTTSSETDVALTIRNTTAGSNLASTARDETHFAAINTWYWQAVVGTGWNGTDTLTLRVTGSGLMLGDIYVDQVIVVAIAGTDFQIDDLAAQALTETRVVPITVRQAN